VSELAHLGPVELFTPKGEESLRFFVEIMGMEIEAQDGPSTYLRGWGDYQRWSLKLTASDTNGMGVLGLRAWSPEALQRRVAAVEAAGLGEGWTDGDLGRGPSYRFRDPDGHVFELYYECERYDPPEHLRPALKNVPGRYTGRGCAVKRLDHVNILATDVRANREFCVDTLGYRLYERIELDDGGEAGAWMSASIAAHELIYTRDALGAHGRLHHPGMFVVGGDLSACGAPFLDGIRDAIDRYAQREAASAVQVTRGLFGARSEVLGALALVVGARGQRLVNLG
jgi:catechol 2,3-dioxygenase